MLKKIKSSLFVKVFALTAALMVACCGVTYGCIASLAPYVYTYNLEPMSELADVMSLEIADIPKEEIPYFLEFYSEMLTDQSNDECVLRLFRSGGQEVSLTNPDETIPGSINDFKDEDIVATTSVKVPDDSGETSFEEFTLAIVRNTAKESQVVEALSKAWPILCVIVLVISFASALVYARFITKPIKELSGVSQSMASLEFIQEYSGRRSDEIGVLGKNLNELSQKLSEALEELRQANMQLQADIDKERELQKQRSYFFSAASHELKTPITVIKGQIEGMVHNVGRYKDRDTYLMESLSAVNRLELMVQELLLATRLEIPDSYSQKEAIDMSELVVEQLSLFEDWATQKNITLHSLITPHVYIEGDVTLIRRVVDSLMNNAVTYSPEGNQVFLALTASEERVCLAVENTGIHIPEDAIPQLFEAFYRVDASRSQLGGTGLGLYLVKTIAEVYGGSAAVLNTGEGVLVDVWFQKASSLPANL